MGVTFLQHRTVTGLHYSINFYQNHGCSKTVNTSVSKDDVKKIVYGSVCVVYVYLLCLLMAGAVETASDKTE